ncbi:MAG: Rossmann-like and DUF2520 domain-containing protein [Anaeroplasmataceae bacterium]
MKIGFIGAGKVGFSLGKYFLLNGIIVKGYYSRNKEDAYLASKFTSLECYDNLNDLIKVCDTLFLTTNDDELGNIINELLKLNIKDKIIIHTSGAASSLDLGHLNEDNYCYSLHPIYAFCDKYESYKGLKNASFTLEGNSLYLSEIKDMITGMGNNCAIIDTKNKPIYHASCVMMSNLVNSLIDVSYSELNRIGITDMSLFQTLIINNITNVINKGPIDALTGPVKRNDVNTIKKHIQVLSDEAKECYLPLTKHLSKVVNSSEINNLIEGVNKNEKNN